MNHLGGTTTDLLLSGQDRIPEAYIQYHIKHTHFVPPLD